METRTKFNLGAMALPILWFILTAIFHYGDVFYNHMTNTELELIPMLATATGITAIVWYFTVRKWDK